MIPSDMVALCAKPTLLLKPMSITDNERLKNQPPKVVKYYKRAKSVVHKAGSVYDLGIARGLLLALKNDGVIDKSILDSLFKGVLDKAGPKLVRKLPKRLVAELGKGVRAPAAPRTRRRRRQMKK